MRYVCRICGYTYDPEAGDPSQGIAPGTAFADLPEAWVCPVCGADRSLFQPESAPEATEEGPGGRVVIVGNGVAGFTVAWELVKRRRGLEIHIAAEERYHYYARPQLPRFLAGELGIEDLLFYEPSWYEAQGIRVWLRDPVVRVDREGRQAELRSGQILSYDWLVIASGSRPATPPIVGRELSGVFTLRTIDDALAIRESALDAQQAVVVGGGLLGLEAGKGLLSLGLSVTVVEVNDHLLPRQLDREGGEVLQRLLEQQGMRFVLGNSVARLVGMDRVREVHLENGQRLRADLVLISAGIRPEIELARDAGLTCDRGVIVDDYLRTSDTRIYACGDVAQHRGRIYGIIPPALDQAQVVAANILGEKVEYHGSIPTASLKVAGIDLTSVGDVLAEGPGVEHIRLMQPEEGRYRKLVLREGKAVGAIAIGFRDQVPRLLQIVAEQADLRSIRRELENPDFDFAS